MVLIRAQLADPDTPTHDFIIHKDLICQHSPCFSQALTSGRSQVHADADPEIFNIVVYWLYFQHVYQEGELFHTPDALANLWMMAESLLMPKLQNLAMDLLFRMQFDYTIKGFSIRQIHERSRAGSPLRAFLAGLCLSLNPSGLLTDEDNISRELLTDTIREAQRRIRAGCQSSTMGWQVEDFLLNVKELKGEEVTKSEEVPKGTEVKSEEFPSGPRIKSET